MMSIESVLKVYGNGIEADDSPTSWAT